MKTLIFNGSPRKDGNCAFCANMIKKNLIGEIITICAYDEDISPCIDCRYCINSKKCSINDDMQKIYKEIIDADRIIIISPLYFSTLTGKILSLFSRLQFFYNTKAKLKPKEGILILLGGGASKNTEPAKLTGRIILRQLNCINIDYLVYTNTDTIPVNNCPSFQTSLINLIEK